MRPSSGEKNLDTDLSHHDRSSKFLNGGECNSKKITSMEKYPGLEKRFIVFSLFLVSLTKFL